MRGWVIKYCASNITRFDTTFVGGSEQHDDVDVVSVSIFWALPAPRGPVQFSDSVHPAHAERDEQSYLLEAAKDGLSTLVDALLDVV